MKILNVMLLLGILLTAGMATASTTVWDPDFNNIFWPDAGYWSDFMNWTQGVPTEEQRVVFNTDYLAAECILDYETAIDKLVLGDGGTWEGQYLTIVDGGSLSTDPTIGGAGWDALGYWRPAFLTVEAGGEFHAGGNLILGRAVAEDDERLPEGAEHSHLLINGGIVTTGGHLLMAPEGGGNTGFGRLTVDKGGVLDIGGNFSLHNTGSMLTNVRFGTIIIDGNRSGSFDSWTSGDDPLVIGFDGAGTVVYDFDVTNPGKTTVTALHPMDPSPRYREIVEAGYVDLNWTNMAANNPGDSVFVDVWFGSDPEDLTQVVTAGENADTVQVYAPIINTPPATYYWRVDSYVGGSASGDPIVGDMFTFDATTYFEPIIEIDTPDAITWVNEPVQLQTTVNFGEEPLSYEWSSSDEGVTFLPSNTAKDPVVTADSELGEVTLTVTVSDSLTPESDSDSVVIYFAADSCDAAIVAGVYADYPMDIAGDDCQIDFLDLQILIEDWLTDYSLIEPVVDPR